MHDAFMLIGIVGLIVLCAEVPVHLLSMHQTYSLLTCTRIPCGGSHCENLTCEVWRSHLPSVAADCCQL